MSPHNISPSPTRPVAARGVAGVLGVYLAYVALFGWMPLTWVGVQDDSIGTLFRERFEGFSGLSRATAWDVWTNLLLFIPCGFLVAHLSPLSGRPWWVITVAAGLIAMLVSGVVEVVQVFLPRSPSVADLTWNAAGGLLGGLLGTFANGWLWRRVHSWYNGVRTRMVLLVVSSGYMVALAIVFGFPVPLPIDFRTWDPTYPLLLGNERTLKRPWQGELHLVAVYDRALVQEEVSKNFSAGSSPSSARHRVGEGLVLLYDFSEGEGDVVHDRVPLEGPVDLRIGNLNRARWLHPNGLLLTGATVVASERPPLKLTGLSAAAGAALSVEAWIKPADLEQAGPARIVSYSRDPEHRNFTLGQEARDVVFRLRTPASGLNGVKPSLKTSDQPLQPALEHLVVTYESGRETLYVNGAMHSTLLLESQDRPVDYLVERLGQEFKWVVYSAMLFPLGIFSYAFAIRNTTSSMGAVSLCVALAGVVLIEGVQLGFAQTPTEPLFYVVAAATLLVSLLAARPILAQR